MSLSALNIPTSTHLSTYWVQWQNGIQLKLDIETSKSSYLYRWGWYNQLDSSTHPVFLSSSFSITNFMRARGRRLHKSKHFECKSYGRGEWEWGSQTHGLREIPYLYEFSLHRSRCSLLFNSGSRSLCHHIIFRLQTYKLMAQETGPWGSSDK